MLINIFYLTMINEKRSLIDRIHIEKLNGFENNAFMVDSMVPFDDVMDFIHLPFLKRVEPYVSGFSVCVFDSKMNFNIYKMSMNIIEAKAISMATGQGIAHKFFTDDEFIRVDVSGMVTTEDPRVPPIDWDEFMAFRPADEWLLDWRILKN